jgi:hypothetical protein
VLIIGETFNQRKESLWSYIHVSQDLIKTIQNCKIGRSPLAREVIAMEREQISSTYNELKQLQRWFKTTELEPDEQYKIKREGKNEQEHGLLA